MAEDRLIQPLTTNRFANKGRANDGMWPTEPDRDKDREMWPQDIQGVKTLILADADYKPMGVPVKMPGSSDMTDFVYVEYPAVLTPEVGFLRPGGNQTIWSNFVDYMAAEHNTTFYDANGTQLDLEYAQNNTQDLSIKNTELFTLGFLRDKNGNVTKHKYESAGFMLDVMTSVTDMEQKNGVRNIAPSVVKQLFFNSVFRNSEVGDRIADDTQLRSFVYGRNDGTSMYVDEYQIKTPLARGYISSVKSNPTGGDYRSGRLVDTGNFESGGSFKGQAEWMARNNPEMNATVISWRGAEDLDAQLDVLRQAGYFQNKYNLVLMGHAASEGFIAIEGNIQIEGGHVIQPTNTDAYGGESIEVLRESFLKVNGLTQLSNIALASCDMGSQAPSCQYLAEEFNADVYAQNSAWGTGHTKPGTGKDLISNVFVHGTEVFVSQPTLYKGAETFQHPDAWNNTSRRNRAGRGEYDGKFKKDWMPANRGQVDRNAINQALKDLEGY